MDYSNAFRYAMLRGREDKMIYYLSMGASINKFNNFGQSPLCVAVNQDNFEMITFLLDNHADPNYVNSLDKSVLHLALRNLYVAKIRYKHYEGSINKANTVKFLLKKHLKFNVINASGENLLHIAAKCGNKEIMELLIQKKINVNQITHNGKTVLHYIIENSLNSAINISMISLLLKAGAKIDLMDDYGDTALYYAVSIDKYKLAEYLLLKGADANSLNCDDCTPMFNAVKRCNITMIELLLKYNGNINFTNHRKNNALCIAMTYLPKGREDAGEEDDYSASACAIIQRRNSSRRHSRRKRRPSSPFSPDVEDPHRRRSSAYTSSSGDTAISIEDSGGGIEEQQIFENLKLHKEVLSGVKQQPWPLRKKLKLVRQAKAYVRKHEGALQERLAQTRSTRDAIARASILLNKNWQYFKREIINLKTFLVPWERRIKQIESQFGSAVASYFIFLRWLFWINLVISAILVTFVAIPELLATLQNATIAGERKTMLPEEQVKSNHLLTLWEFEGNLKYSPFFYGWYANQHTYKAYKLPLAYFVVNLVVYTYSFVVILRKMAKNSRMSKLSEKEDECAFSWKLFTGWDFMIGNAETANNRIGSIVLGLKEALLEESEKHRDERNWKIISIRIFVNLLVMGMLAISAYAVVEVVERSENIEDTNRNWWRQNEITVVMTLISYSFPILFEVLGIIESHHPRKQLRLQLGRIMILNLLNMYSLIYALFKKINSSDEKLQGLKPIDSASEMSCFDKLVPCASSIVAMSLVLHSNLSSTFKLKENVGLSPKSYARYSAEIRNHTSVMDDEFLHSSYEEIPLYKNVNASGIFDEWTTKAEESNENFSTLIDPSNYGSSNFTTENITEAFDSIETSSSNSLKVRNSIREIDENAININENKIFFEDDYPHINYNDYGFLELDNATVDYFQDSPSPSPGYSTDNVESSFSRSTFTTSIVNPNIPTDIPTNSCSELTQVLRCYERICEMKTITSDNNFSVSTTSLDIKTRRLLRGLCWETMFGQEIAKLTMMDLVLTVFSTMGMDFFRAIFVRYMNNCWCWDLEKQFPQYGDFKIAENILHLVNNQGMVWMGIFFSPGLIVLNVIKLIILMYLRSWTVLTCNVPHEIVFRASRSNNFYLALLLTMLFLCVLPVGYAIVWVEPSWHCGPFSGYKRIYHLATTSLRNALPSYIHEYRVLDYIASPGIVIPLIVLMALIIYYMVSLTNSLRESNNDLKIQLRQERTEERRKMFRIVERRFDAHETPFARWKKILPGIGTNKLADVILEKVGIAEMEDRELKRQSGGSENGELTEAEQESLPHDPPAPVELNECEDLMPRVRERINEEPTSPTIKSGNERLPSC